MAIRSLSYSLLLWIVSYISKGSSQICSSSDNRGLAITGDIDVPVQVFMPDPVCIRCGYLDGNTVVLVTDTDDVTYNTGGNVIVNTTDISVTNDGLILNDPGNTFSDDTAIVCTFNQPGMGSVSRTIAIEHLMNNPPTLNPDGGDDRVVYVTEGFNITLTCTRDSENSDGDLYQWIHSNSQMTPGAPTDSPVQLSLNNINRKERGVYICQGSRNGVTVSALKNNVTLNVQYPAKILSFTPGNTTLTVNSTLVLNCTFEGNPTPDTIAWSHNRSEVFPAPDPNLSQTDTSTYSLLEVNFTNINISGEYACGVNNSLDFDQTDFTFITVQVAPGPVVNLLNDSSTTTTVTLSWTFGFDGNAEIAGVNISYTAIANYGPSDDGAANGSVSTTDGGQISITINGLQPLTTYQFTVRVRNTVSDEVGVSSPVSVTADTLPLVPDPPTLNSVTAVSSTELRVEWTANLNTNTQTPIISFVVYYNVLGNNSVQNKTVEDGAATSTSITGLMKGTSYQVKVVSSNEVGPSISSNTIKKRTDIDPPSAVTNLTATAFSFSICVLWKIPADNGGQDIQGYRIQKWNRNKYQLENFTFVADVDAAVLTFTVENLDNNIDYSIQVAANNIKNGEGGFGDPSSVNASTELEIEVSGPTTRTVVEGETVVLLCNLNSGGGAPNVTWKFNGMDVPMSAHVDGHTLTIISPQLSNAGNYTCFSRAGTPNEASFTFSLSVMPRYMTLTPSVSLCSCLPVYGQISIFVILSCICIFLLSLNIAQYLWYRRYEILKKNSIKPLPRIDEKNDDYSSISLKESQEPSTDNNLAYGKRELPHAYHETDTDHTDHEPMYESPAL